VVAHLVILFGRLFGYLLSTHLTVKLLIFQSQGLSLFRIHQGEILRISSDKCANIGRLYFVLDQLVSSAIQPHEVVDVLLSFDYFQLMEFFRSVVYQHNILDYSRLGLNLIHYSLLGCLTLFIGWFVEELLDVHLGLMLCLHFWSWIV
jgi:hypothetical protein